MVSEILRMVRGTSLIKKALSEFVSMIGNCDYLYNESWRVLSTQENIEKIPQYFFDRDIIVNGQEKEIRRLLLEHLSINPLHDLSGALALMSLVKDAERIGDYSKNLFEVGILYKGTVKNIKYFDRLAANQIEIAGNFPKLKEAFEKSDAKMAQEILDKYVPIKKECDRILYDLFDENLSPNEAIATGMLTRHFKRINSHLSNIASGIIYPLEEIDFVKGDLLE
ncbi:PhoU domain-containing protein [Chloroflexota bacterium]